jgi:hypothetical protein
MSLALLYSRLVVTVIDTDGDTLEQRIFLCDGYVKIIHTNTYTNTSEQAMMSKPKKSEEQEEEFIQIYERILILLLPGFCSQIQAKTALTTPLHRILSDAVPFQFLTPSVCRSC